jgi:cytochrome c-type biogenesis protein CcmH
MSWLYAIILALAAFAAMALPFRLPRKSWLILLAALTFGLAGYATQASPGVQGAPKSAQDDPLLNGEQIVNLRTNLVGARYRSRSNFIYMADAWVREGRYEGAVTLLRGVIHNNPNDGDAWLAMAIALQLHANGALTPASEHAFAKSIETLPMSAGPALFLGATLIAQGDADSLIAAHRLWSSQLEVLPQEAIGRPLLEQRLAGLDQLLRQAAGDSPQDGQ